MSTPDQHDEVDEVDVDDDLDLDDDAPADFRSGEVLDWRIVGLGLVVLGVLGLIAAFTLAVDKVKMLEDPSFVPSCNLNPVLSCGDVMVTDQAQAFGFPNPFLGIGGFAVVITLGVLLLSGVRVPRWMIAGVAVVAVAATVFIHWLAFQSLYRIGALCPWCLVVWAVTVPIALWSVLLALRPDTGRPSRAWSAVWSVRFLLLMAWYLLVVVLILIRFWDYWRTLV